MVAFCFAYAEDDSRALGDDELDRQIQSQWELLVGSETSQKPARKPVLKTSVTRQASEPKPEVIRQTESSKSTKIKSATKLEVLEDDEPADDVKVGYNQLMEELKHDTLLTPIQIDKHRIQQFQNLIIQNKSIENGYVGITQNKKGEYELRVYGSEDQSVTGISNLFDVENSKLFVKIKHHSFERLMGYYDHWMDSSMISYKEVRLKKDYEGGKTFWSRWNIVPVLGEEWYLLQSYYDPKKCMAVKRNQEMVIRSCKSIDERQFWRFVKKPGFGVEDTARDPGFPIL